MDATNTVSAMKAMKRMAVMKSVKAVAEYSRQGGPYVADGH